MKITGTGKKLLTGLYEVTNGGKNPVRFRTGELARQFGLHYSQACAMRNRLTDLGLIEHEKVGAYYHGRTYRITDVGRSYMEQELSIANSIPGTAKCFLEGIRFYEGQPYLYDETLQDRTGLSRKGFVGARLWLAKNGFLHVDVMYDKPGMPRAYMESSPEHV